MNISIVFQPIYFFVGLLLTFCIFFFPGVWKAFRKAYNFYPWEMPAKSRVKFRKIWLVLSLVNLVYATILWFNTIGIVIAYWIIVLLSLFISKHIAFKGVRKRTVKYLIVSTILTVAAITFTVILVR